jgi:hypothetical protein
MISNEMMTVLTETLNKITEAGFYTALGIDKPTSLSVLALHDCIDHGMTWDNQVIPTTIVGEMYAMANYEARQYARIKRKYPQGSSKILTFCEFCENTLDLLKEFPVTEGEEVVGVEDLSYHYKSLNLKEIYIYYRKAFKWWLVHPHLESISEFY